MSLLMNEGEGRMQVQIDFLSLIATFITFRMFSPCRMANSDATQGKSGAMAQSRGATPERRK